ncbi:MAG: response regulator [Deltaproteobacteria bacterium]|nr:response regulator [Deltaproteobacteria bacterium]
MTIDDKDREQTTRVLIVDDEEIVHASLQRILNRAGYETESVFLARDGLDRLAKERFELVILDLMMPGMTGLEFLEELRGNGSSIPVLMVTGYPTIGTAVQALRLGAVDYIAKPFTRKELLGPVQRSFSLTEEDTLPDSESIGEIIKKEDLMPGVVAVLPRHAWASYEQDGTFLIGVEESFLRICNQVVSLSIPNEMDLIEQGYVSIYLTNENQEDHGVAIPLSGQVVAINQDVLDDPSSLTADSWLVRIIPSHIDDELGRLVRRS